MQIGDAPHRQAGQIAHKDAFGIGDCDGQSADGFGLVDDEEDLAAPHELLDHGAQSCLVVGERFVVKPFPGAVEGDRVMFAFSNVNTYEHVNAVVILNHEFSRQPCGSVGLSTASSLGIHVTFDPEKSSSRAPISDHPIPVRPGDNTPRIINDWGR